MMAKVAMDPSKPQTIVKERSADDLFAFMVQDGLQRANQNS